MDVVSKLRESTKYKRITRMSIIFAERNGVLISKDKVKYKNHTVHSRHWEKRLGKDKLKNIIELKCNSYLHMTHLFDLERISTIIWLINLTYKKTNPSGIKRTSGNGNFIRQWLMHTYPAFEIDHISEGELVLSMLMSRYLLEITLEKVSLKRRFFFDAEPIKIKAIQGDSGIVIPKRINYNSFEEADEASFNQYMCNGITN